MSLFQDLYQKMKSTEAKNEQDFNKFIDTSITVVESLEYPKSQNKALWTRMQAQIKKFTNTKIGDTPPDDILDSNSAYQAQMSRVSLDFNAEERQKRLQAQQQDQQNRLQTSEQYIDKNSIKPGEK